MLETMMHSGGYRIEYLNLHAAGTDRGFGLYVCGKLENGQPYSRQARHQLLAGLQQITSSNELDYLVAVYVDICDRADLKRPARQQLLKDLSAGLFKRVMLYTSEEHLLPVSAYVNFVGSNSDQAEFWLMSTERQTFTLPAEPCRCDSMN